MTKQKFNWFIADLETELENVKTYEDYKRLCGAVAHFQLLGKLTMNQGLEATAFINSKVNEEWKKRSYEEAVASSRRYFDTLLKKNA